MSVDKKDKSFHYFFKVIFLGITFFFSQHAVCQTDVDLAPELNGRVSVGVEKNIFKGLSIFLEEEARFDDNFKSFDRFHTSLGMGYRVNQYFKLDMAYVFIAPYSSSNGFSLLRHRTFVDATGSVHFGKFSLSLKERFQWTYMAGDINVFQTPRNVFHLKSKLTAKYKFKKVAPYIFFEIRYYLNAPVVHANYDGEHYLTDSGSEIGEPGWFLQGNHGGYINRYRSCIGTDVKINSKNELNFYFLGDYVIDKEINTNPNGTQLLKYTKEKGFIGTLGAEYKYSF